MILLIYSVCIVSVFIFVIFGTILSVHILRKSFDATENTNIKNCAENEETEPIINSEETSQKEKTQEALNSNNIIEIFTNKMINDTAFATLMMMFEEKNDDFDIWKDEESNNKKRS